MNVKSYLEIIKYKGSVDVSLDLLRQLSELHRRYVPFNNLSIFGGRYKTLDLNDIFNEVVLNKRGGYCYELNALFHWLLNELGFQVKIVQGSMYIEPGSGPDCSHMTLLVTLTEGEQWLTDVAWTGCGLLTPLRFELDTEQTQENVGIFRIRKNPFDNDTFIVEIARKTTLKSNEHASTSGMKMKTEKWKILYKFDTAPRAMEEFAEMNSRQQDVAAGDLFTARNTFCCVTRRDGCTLLWGNEIVIKKYDAPLTQRVIASRVYHDVDELKNAIRDEFGIHVDYDLKPLRQEHESDSL